MILLLQNLLHYTGDYINKKYSPILTANDYPNQNLDFINKLLFIPYKDENLVRLNYRLYVPAKFKEFTGKNGPYDNYTKVLRFDMAEPYVAIIVDKNDRIIVADTREILNYKFYSQYTYSNYKGIEEAHIPDAMVDWDTFNEEYANEKIWDIHVQNKEYLGMPAYIEYFDDIVDSDKENILPYYNSEKMEAYSRHSQDLLDRPTKATEKGYIIRSDESGDTAEIVVMIVKYDDEGKELVKDRKFILGSEALIYIDTNDTQVSLGDLNLWLLQ